MNHRAALRNIFLVLALLVLLSGGLAWAWQSARAQLARQVAAALGPQASVGSITMQGLDIVVQELRLPGPSGWPAADQLRAAEIRLRPDWRSLLGILGDSPVVRISHIGVQQAYLSVLRQRDGRIALLPDLLGKPAHTEPGAPIPRLQIGLVELTNSQIEFIDASIRRTPHRIQLTHISLTLSDLHLPELNARSQLQLSAQLPGPRHTGSLEVSGAIVLSNRDAQISTQLRSLDLLTVQPYLLQAADTRITGGTADLSLQSTVQQQQLKAPGTLTLNKLTLADGGSGGATFMGVPRRAVLAFLSDRQGRIELSFTLTGRLDDPNFSLNESIGRELASSMAHQLGLGLDALARGAGTVGQATGQVIEQVGGALRGLFGRP
jgi:CheY-like chemotaxis protein